MRSFIISLVLLSSCGRPEEYFKCLRVCETGLSACDIACSSAGMQCDAFCQKTGEQCADACENGSSFDPKSFVPSESLLCKAEGTSCTSFDTHGCCDGFTCDEATFKCAKPKPVVTPIPGPVCKARGESCTKSADCCSPLFCDFGECF